MNVAVCTTGHVWAVGPDNTVHFRTGIVGENVIGDGWDLVETGLLTGDYLQVT